MVTTVRGHIQGGMVVPDTPLNMPDGLEVELQITASDSSDQPANQYDPAIESVFGMWADREDMADSTSWVRKQRDAWNDRLTRDRD
jgi:hypothetical protein